jgi:Golgi apparatus protein 1
LVLPAGPTFPQQDVTKPLVDKLTARIAKLESVCANENKTYCNKSVTPGEGRLIYCMQAHDDKISHHCDYELREIASSVQAPWTD